MVNTGYKGYTALKKVVNGGVNDGQPLDINNELCSISGLIQSTKTNISSDSNYIAPIIDYITCPISSLSTSIGLRFSFSDLDICTSSPNIVYINSNLRDITIGTSIYANPALTTLYSSPTFVVSLAGAIYGLTGGVVTSSGNTFC